MKIKVPPRYRKDLGDLTDLTQSIRDIGLLQPIVVSDDGTLIAGARRRAACHSLGMSDDEIPMIVVPLKDIALGEFAENSFRKDFTPSEAWAIYQAIKPLEEAAAKSRRGARTDLRPGADFAPGRVGKSRQHAASYTGYSHATLKLAGEVVDAATADDRYRPFVEEMDRAGRVHPVHRRFVRAHQLNEARRRSETLGKSSLRLGETSRIKYKDHGVTLIYGDCRHMSELEDESVDLVITDPPMNVGINYGPEVNDNIDPNEYARWTREWLDECLRVLKPGGQLVAAMPAKWMLWWLPEIEDLWHEHRGHILIWNKSMAAMHRENTWIRAWEPVLWIAKGGSPAIFKRTYKLKDDRDWFIGPSAAGEIRAQGLTGVHPAPRPVSFYMRFIEKCTEPGMLVVDPMMGSGSGALAAAKAGRRFVGYDIVERYVFLAERRVKRLLANPDIMTVPATL